MRLLVAKLLSHFRATSLVQFVCMKANTIDPVAAIVAELQMAATARSGGNEGKARVCARRAAGWAIRGWMERRGVRQRGQSAHRYLEGAKLDRSLPAHIRTAAAHLVIRINEDHVLPIDADVLDDARVLVDFFLALDDDSWRTHPTRRIMMKNE